MDFSSKLGIFGLFGLDTGLFYLYTAYQNAFFMSKVVLKNGTINCEVARDMAHWPSNYSTESEMGLRPLWAIRKRIILLYTDIM